MLIGFSTKRWVCNASISIVIFIGFAQPLFSQTNQIAQFENDCYFNESENNAIIGNSKIEIQIDGLHGTITGMLNKTTGIQYLGKGKPDIFRMEYSTLESHGATSKDVWSAGYGSIIYGSKQKIGSVKFNKTVTGSQLEISYDSLYLERKSIPVSVKYTIELKIRDEETLWRISIDNRDPGTIREVRFPITSGLARMDNLIMPNHGGQKIIDPISKLSDEIPNVYLEYPARASMQWFDYFSQNAGLYMASYDKNIEYTRMYFGRQGESAEAAMWLVKYPFVISGGKWESTDLAVGAHSGDWHWGADAYRSWLQSWVQKPRPPKHITEMINGDGALYIKGRGEERLHTYDDIVTHSREGQNGANSIGLMLVGWFFNGHDTYFPEYNAIPDLGGDKALTDAINKVHARGGMVNAYMNGRISNIETETYKKFGKKWAVLGMAPGLGVGNISFFELHEGWNKTWELTKKSEGWFSVMCPSAKGWQDHIVGQVMHGLSAYHFDGIFLDQPGSYYAELCYNANHGHTTPATAWGPGLLQIFKRIQQEGKKINPEFAIWTEGMNDVYGQYLDFHTDKNPVWAPMRLHPEAETFVEMWRYTLPWYITQNGPGKYSYPPSKDKVYGDYYRFVMGIRGISKGGGVENGSLNRTAADSLAHDAVVNKIEKLWNKGSEYFFYGQFTDDIGLKVSDKNVLAKCYVNGNSVAVPVWNTTGQPITFELSVDINTLIKPGSKLKEITFLEDNKRIPYKAADNYVTMKFQLQPNDVAVVIVKGNP